MSRLTDIRATRARSQRRDLYLDGEYWRSTALPVVRALSISADDEVDPEELAASLLAEEVTASRARALRLLRYRERSSAEVAERLAEDGYPDSVITATLECLTEAGFVDDDRFLEIYLRQLIEIRGLGRHRVEVELRRKGIAGDAAEGLLDATCSPANEFGRALTRARALHSRGVADPRALTRRLLSRGYALDVARRAADAVAAEGPQARSEPS